MMFGGQSAAQFVTPGFFALALAAIWAVVRRCGAGPPDAVWAIACAAAVPFFHWSGSVAKNDMQVVLYQFAALYALLRWRESGRFRWAALAAGLAGASFGVKHPALFGGLPLGLLLGQAAWREPRRVRAAFALLLVFLAFCAIWYVRTGVLTGNPVYPLEPGRSDAPGRAAYSGWLAQALRVAALPFTLPFGGLRYIELPLATPIGIALVLFWPVWFVSGRPGRDERICLFYAVLGFLWWGWMSPVVRYAAGPIAVFAALTGARASRYFREGTSVVRASAVLAALWCLTQALCAVMPIEINAPQLQYLAGRIGRNEYLRAAALPYPALEFVNAATGAGDRILALENCMDAYAPPAPRYLSQCGGSWDAAAILQQLRRDRFTWLVAPVDRIDQARAALREYGLEGDEKYRDRAFTVLRLREALR
jgi:hypothetical protein